MKERHSRKFFHILVIYLLNFQHRHSFRIDEALDGQELRGALKSTDSEGKKKYKNRAALNRLIQENKDLLDAYEIAQRRSIRTIRLGEFSATGFQAAVTAGDERRRALIERRRALIKSKAISGGGGGGGGGRVEPAWVADESGQREAFRKAQAPLIRAEMGGAEFLVPPRGNRMEGWGEDAQIERIRSIVTANIRARIDSMAPFRGNKPPPPPAPSDP